MLADGLAIVQGNGPLTQQSIQDYFNRNPFNRYRFNFGIDVEPDVYRQLIANAHGLGHPDDENYQDRVDEFFYNDHNGSHFDHHLFYD